mgnify:CR=1 FL=1
MIEQLASVSLSCSVVILLLLFLRPLLCRRYRAKLRYWIWLALAVRLLVPLSPSWPASPVALPSLPETAVSFSVPLSGGETAVPAGGEVLTPAVPSLSVSGLLTAVWAAGAVVFLAWHLLAAFFFRRKAVRWSTMFQNGRPDVLMCKCTPSPKSCSPLSFLFLCVFFLRVTDTVLFLRLSESRHGHAGPVRGSENGSLQIGAEHFGAGGFQLFERHGVRMAVIVIHAAADDGILRRHRVEESRRGRRLAAVVPALEHGRRKRPVKRLSLIHI